jgi:hypothetical protein
MAIEIWRVHNVLGSGKSSANIAVKVHPSIDAQPCTDNINDDSHRLGEMPVNPGSPNIDITGDESEFDLTD